MCICMYGSVFACGKLYNCHPTLFFCYTCVCVDPLPTILLQLPEGGAHYNIPLGTKALYFNLTKVFPNGTTITSGEYGTAPIIRTSVINQKFKSLSLTLSSNTSRTVVHFVLKGKSVNDTGKEIKVKRYLITLSLFHSLHVHVFQSYQFFHCCMFATCLKP